MDLPEHFAGLKIATVVTVVVETGLCRWPRDSVSPVLANRFLLDGRESSGRPSHLLPDGRRPRFRYYPQAVVGQNLRPLYQLPLTDD